MSYPNPHPHSCPWHSFTEAVGAPNIKWCEETLCGWITEPANTWSNLAYILASFIIFRFMKDEKSAELKFLAPTMFVMGLFSLAFHLSNNYVSQMLDYVGMFFFLNWLGILSLKRGKIIKEKLLVPLYLVLSFTQIALVHLFYLNELKYQNLVLVSIGMTLFSELYLFVKNQKPHNYFYLGLFIVGLAQLCSLLDSKRIFCYPENHWFQLHAAQHILSAIGLTIATLHYRQKSREISKE
jgi:hypothetical protein